MNTFDFVERLKKINTYIRANPYKVLAGVIFVFLLLFCVTGCQTTSSAPVTSVSQAAVKTEAAYDSAQKTQQLIAISRDAASSTQADPLVIESIDNSLDSSKSTVGLLEDASREANQAVVDTAKLAKNEAKLKEALDRERASFFSHQQRTILISVSVLVFIFVVIRLLAGSNVKWATTAISYLTFWRKK